MAHVRAFTLGVLLLAAAATCNAAKTACPSRTGYQVFADMHYGTTSALSTFSSMAAAESSCQSASSCVSFSSLGETVSGTVTLTASIGVCVYIKGICPVKSGYTAYNHTTMLLVRSDETISGSHAAGAEVACTANRNCPGFSVSASGSSGGTFFATQGKIKSLSFQYGQCTYLKNNLEGYTCAPKYGYTNMYHTSAEGAEGAYGSVSGDMPGGAANAEMACKVNPKCTAWSTDGKVQIGGVRKLNTEQYGTCTYLKDPCPPMAGFTAYPDFTDATTAYSFQDKTLCVADTYTRCFNDATCQGFDMLRKFWTSKPNPTSRQFGMCTYVRASGY
ncbi:hypothetical protein Vretimale_6322 [Volvox reticuliferus]|uniref:Uncharacterized protein n=1 Tax=Volvox reticuliferus TaxID=1737510 RepID=A0A8J4FUZ3_9CHLO|nr:hypothetical protein Vretifemale_15994 [Volvox reticuliferus]GIM01535.1 hypothetical protein Vretimale_6322 [Volvox reticuliferus]